MSVKLILISCLLSASLAGCASDGQQTRVAAVSDFAHSEVGHGAHVQLVVNGRRPALGRARQPPRSCNGGGIVSARQDLVAAVRENIKRALKANDFRVVGDAGADAHELRVVVQHLQRAGSKESAARGESSPEVLDVTVLKGRHQAYKSEYCSGAPSKHAADPTAEQKTARVNTALHSMVLRMMSDPRLIDALRGIPEVHVLGGHTVVLPARDRSGANKPGAPI